MRPSTADPCPAALKLSDRTPSSVTRVTNVTSETAACQVMDGAQVPRRAYTRAAPARRTLRAMGHETLDPGLVTALLSARDDAATRAFDDAIRLAQSVGYLDAVAARELTYWQRRRIEGLVEHAAAVLPAALEARRRSDIAARGATAEARASWTQARALQQSQQAEPASDSHSSDSSDSSDSPASVAALNDVANVGAPSRRPGAAGLSVVSDDD